MYVYASAQRDDGSLGEVKKSQNCGKQWDANGPTQAHTCHAYNEKQIRNASSTFAIGKNGEKEWKTSIVIHSRLQSQLKLVEHSTEEPSQPMKNEWDINGNLCELRLLFPHLVL